MPLIAWAILMPVVALMAIDYTVGHSSKDQPEPISQEQVPSLSEPEAPGSGLNAYPAPVKVTTPSVPTSQPVAKPIEKKEKNDTLPPSNYIPPASTMTLTPFKSSKSAPITPPTPHTTYGSVDPDKQSACKKVAKQCMSEIKYKVGGLSGSAQQMAIKSYGDTCNAQYKVCVKY